ncbi:MAG: hypothetical protein OXE94_14655 [Aestuariivita sp.]|nr:hypothetical protein [Aestuariivita sp.]MCY4203096.1 hypothetical protein [Aestuariivita sp.]MCY4287154.1 hypothetical protein [Aestuariivita sp.]MCY4347575.1 hypothetical protein [Aestuariivita sp.]
MTDTRHGHGRGKPVIWTGQEDRVAPVPVDRRQYNLIIGENGEADALRTTQINRIRAVLS